MADNDLIRPVVGLIINALLLPGLGTLVGGGRVRDGIIQLALMIVLAGGIFTAVVSITRLQGPDASQAVFPFAIVALVLALGVWIWSIVSMAGEISRRSKASRTP